MGALLGGGLMSGQETVDEEEPLLTVIVDPQEIMREGLRGVLEQSGFKLVGAYREVDEIRRADHHQAPDLILADIGTSNGQWDLLPKLRARWPDARILALATQADPDTLSQALRAGASGYATKTVTADMLLAGARAVARGETFLCPQAAAEAARFLRAGVPLAWQRNLNLLTPQEARIANLIGDGLSNEQIAHRLRLAPKTVRNYTSKVLSKLGLGRRSELAVYLRRHRQSIAS